MKSLTSRMVLRRLTGIWLFISPFVMEFREMTKVSVNNIMMVGAVLFILGLGVALYEYPRKGEGGFGLEYMSRKSA